MRKKMYTAAPMPFMGQKRRFIKHFKNALNDFDQAKIFVDLFGGSGLLSHITKQERPDAVVIYNDFDDYHIRLINVHKTNRMLDHIRKLTKDLPKDKKIPNDVKQQLLNYIKNEDKAGFVDYITLSSSLLFSMNYVLNFEELEKQTMYNCVRQSNYVVDGYLDGLHIVKHDYKTLFNKYKDSENVVFFVDPPYLSTEVGTYNNYWKLADYLDVLKVLKDSSYFYFTSNKSSIIELCEWIETNFDKANPFENATKEEMQVKVNHNAGYNDIMLYKNYFSTTSGSMQETDYVTSIS